MRKPIFTLLYLLFAVSVFSQSNTKNRIDSFDLAIKELNNNAKLEAYLEMADISISDTIEQAKVYAIAALKIARKSNKQKEIATAYQLLAKIYYQTGEYEESETNWNLSKTIYEKLGNNEGISEALSGIGYIYFSSGEYNKAIDYFNQALEFDFNTKEKTNVSSRLNAIGISYKRLGEFDKAIKYYTDALKIDEESGNEENMAIDYNNIGAIYNARGKYSEAIEYYGKALELDKKLNKKTDVAIDLNNLGMVYYSQGEYAKAIEHYKEAINILKQTGNNANLSTFISNIGSVYDSWGQHAKALEYYNQSLELNTKLNREVAIAGDLNNIGSVHFMLGNYDEAAKNYDKAIAIFREMGAISAVAVLLTNLGQVYKKWGQYEKAINTFEEALEIDKKLNKQADIASDLAIIGDLYAEQGYYQKSIPFYQEAYERAKAIDAKAVLLDVLKSYAAAYDSLGNLSKAYIYFKDYTILKDSIFNEEKHKQMAEFQTKYETQEKEAQIKVQQADIEKQAAENKRQKAVNISIIIVLGLVIGLIFIVLRSLQRKKRDNKIIQEEKAKSEELLLNTLPLKVVNDLKETGITKPENFDNVSVYFSDIVGFTSISSTLDPTLLINELNEIFTAFDDIMDKYGCERLKTIGDAYLAVCGMPEPNPNHAENMVKASMEIVDYMEHRRRTTNIDWRIRIGVHSGKVVGGIVGVRKYIYDVFGDTINTASRMESNGVPMRINVSKVTHDLLLDKFNFTERDPLEIKGKGVMNMYFVDGEK